MKNWKTPALVLALATALCFSAAWVGSAQEDGGEPQMSAEAQAEMEAWMKLAQPGEHHQHLAPYEGKWKAQMKMWMAPGSEPMENESESEVRWLMGGRYLEWTVTGDFAGMPFDGRGIDAYNNGDGRYESVWMDNFGTLLVFYTGECSDDGKTRVMKGSFSNPMEGTTIDQEVVYSWLDADHFKYESFMKQGDEEYKNMEMLFERQ